jgi:serine/threonine-protein kinase
LDAPIAAGGVGEVWRATDSTLNRQVAVKLLRPEYADHPETLVRFRAEARHAGSLTHPCIAQVYDYGETGPTSSPYLVMELVDGPSLADMLDQGPLRPVQVLDIIAQAAAGLDAAHRAGLVHRDIKPGNILISPDGLVKITDFGIAHAAGSAPVTRPGVVMGTTQYLAPERARGGAGTPASDLYALGIVAHECLTGIPPFLGTTGDMMAAHLYRSLPPLPAGVPPELSEMLAKLTAKNPAERYASAGELAAEAGQLCTMLADAPATADAMDASNTPNPSGASDAAGEPAAQPPWADRPPRPSQAFPTEPAARPDGATAGRSRRRTNVAVAASATVLAGATGLGLLVSGALHASSAAEHSPTTPKAHQGQQANPVTLPTATAPRTPGDVSTNAPRGTDPAATSGSGPSATPTSGGGKSHPSPSPDRSAQPSGASGTEPTPSPSKTGGGGLPLPLPSFTLFGLPL